MTAIGLSMDTQFVNKEEVVNDTRSEYSVTLCLFAQQVFTKKLYSVSFKYFLSVEKR